MIYLFKIGLVWCRGGVKYSLQAEMECIFYFYFFWRKSRFNFITRKSYDKKHARIESVGWVCENLTEKWKKKREKKSVVIVVCMSAGGYLLWYIHAYFKFTTDPIIWESIRYFDVPKPWTPMIWLKLCIDTYACHNVDYKLPTGKRCMLLTSDLRQGLYVLCRRSCFSHVLSLGWIEGFKIFWEYNFHLNLVAGRIQLNLALHLPTTIYRLG